MAVAALDRDISGDDEPFTAAWHAPFIEAYVRLASIPRAAAECGVTHQAVYTALRKDARLIEAYQRARSVLGAEMEGLLLKKCREGDTIALIFVNKNLNQETYSDRVELRGTVAHRHELEITGGKDPVKLDAARRHEAARLLLEGVDEPPIDAVVVDEDEPAAAEDATQDTTP